MPVRSQQVSHDGGSPSFRSPRPGARRPLSIRSIDAHHQAVSQAQMLRRIRGEFAEMRGFSPTLAQAARLFDLPHDVCRGLLAALVRDGSLRQGEDGRFRLA